MLLNGFQLVLVIRQERLFSTAAQRQRATPAGYQWVDHEEFENACYKRFDAKDTDANPCTAPNKNEEFNPFAANPVGFRWFKGVTLFTAATSKIPDKGVYLGIFKVLSTSAGFKVMVIRPKNVRIFGKTLSPAILVFLGGPAGGSALERASPPTEGLGL